MYASNGCNPIHSSGGYRNRATRATEGERRIVSTSCQRANARAAPSAARGKRGALSLTRSSLDSRLAPSVELKVRAIRFLRTRRPRLGGSEVAALTQSPSCLTIPHLIWKVLNEAFLNTIGPRQGLQTPPSVRPPRPRSHRMPVHLLSGETRLRRKSPTAAPDVSGACGRLRWRGCD